MKKVISIEGMSCGHCSMRVKKAIGELAGVSGVEVDLGAKRATVEGEALDDAALKAAVEDAGYDVTAIA